MSLTTKLAEDFADLGGVRVLREATEDSIRPVFDDYFAENGVSSAEDRLALCAEYFKVMGMGVMELSGDVDGGNVRLAHSHVDEGWIKKWKETDKPINHFTCGFIAAAFAASFDKPARSFDVTETSSIVMGAPESVFVVKPS
jgi:predicted hydrocarbon binding protein